MESPIIGAPEGEVVQGEAMDLGEEKESKGKNGDPEEEEPEVGDAVQQRWTDSSLRVKKS